MAQIGQWMRSNGDVFAIYLPDDNERALPERLLIPGPAPVAGSKVQLLGTDAALHWSRVGEQTQMRFPAGVRKQTAGAYAWALRLPAAAVH